MKRLTTFVALILAFTAHGVSAQTLKAVKDRGMLNCGERKLFAFSGTIKRVKMRQMHSVSMPA